MKSKRVCGLVLTIASLAAFLVSGANAQSGKPSKPAGGGPSTPANTAATPDAASPQKVVLKVGATQVTESEMESLVSKLGPRAKTIVAAEGRRPVGDEYVKMLLLSQQAIDEHLDLSPDLRSQLELQRARTLAEAEYQKMASQVQVSPEEVSQYFAVHQPEFEAVQVQQFIIRKRPQGSQDTKQGLTAEQARAKAESIRKALLAGTDVEKVAETFVEMPNVMLLDWKPRTLRRGEMVPALEKATFGLKDGGVSEPVDTPQAFMVVKVLQHQHPELKEVSAEIETKLRQQKLDARVDDLKKRAGVWMDSAYFGAKPVATPASPAQSPASAPAPKP